MIDALIRWSLANRVLVLLLAGVLALGGFQAMHSIPVDALPDLSDVQVIVHTRHPGQAPGVIEDQVTYPLSTAMLTVPGARTVRAYSFFGDSYVYVLFDEGTDLYWARSRVLEALGQVSSQLPPGVQPRLGPDATGVGWVYEYALVDRSGQHDLAELRSLQDWFLRFELQTVPGVAEVAPIGGMLRQYQVVVDPGALLRHGLTLARVRSAIQSGNAEVGGSVIEMAEAEYMVRATGYVSSARDLQDIPLGHSSSGTPLLLADVARVEQGPAMRRGIADLNGEGEVVGAVVVMRSGENASRVIRDVRQRLKQLRAGLPDGVEVVETYNRASLIQRAIATLRGKLVEEMLVVVAVCALFLFHLRSALVILVSLPLGILAAFLVMHWQGLNANIMSLGGIAIAIGAMVDAAIVMIENLHKRMERPDYHPDRHWQVVGEAALEVGPPLFFSLLIITISFLPVFTLQAQEGRLFAPLAWTKTWSMAAAAGLAVTLVPVLMGYLVRGRIRAERDNPLLRWTQAAYRPVIRSVVARPLLWVTLALLVTASALYPLSRLGTEFMPELDEGDLMYMPSTLPALSAGEALQLLQQTDRLIASVPEVQQVFGKIGRAESATDPAPMSMIETVVRLKPREQWRPGMDMAAIRAELDRRVQLPGVTNAWVWPIKTRIDMLATGIKTPVGIKVAGPELDVIQRIGGEIERLLEDLPGTASVFSERVHGGRYLTIDIDRAAAARHGLNIREVQEVVESAVGGKVVSVAVEGLARYGISLRYPRGLRDSLADLQALPIVSQQGHNLTLSEVAELRIEAGPSVIKTENARPNGWILVDIKDVNLAEYVDRGQQRLAERLTLPAGYSVHWSGQYEYLERARQRLALVAPLTLASIALLLFLAFRRLVPVVIVLVTLPMALSGGFWLLWWLDYQLSVAVAVGLIALAGVAVEIGVVLITYLDASLAQAASRARHEGKPLSSEALREAVIDGCLLRLRPVLMTVSTIVVGLITVMIGAGTGSEVMRRIAAPMVGGMLSATLLTLLVVPACYLIWQRRLVKPAPDGPA